LTVDLILKAGDGQERTARMEADGDRYRLTAVPIPGGVQPRKLRLAARFGNAMLEATTTERSITIAGRELGLGEVRTIFPGSPSRVVLQGGESIAGALVGLGAVPIRLGRRTESVNLAGAKEVTITPVEGSDQVECTVLLRQGMTEIYRQRQSFDANGPVPPDISGRWFCDGRLCNITRTGPRTYDFQNEHGTVFPNGRLVSGTEIDAWECKGILRELGGRMIIAWSNGTEWVRPSVSSGEKR
jgi:hypothetical protein